MNHADPQRRGVVGVVDLHDLAVLADLARLGLVQTEQHTHQGGLSGAVLAQKRVDLALLQLKRDVVVGLDSGEFLGNMEHFDDILHICHDLTCFRPVIPLLYRRRGKKASCIPPTGANKKEP